MPRLLYLEPNPGPLGLGAMHTARNGNVASIHRDSLGVRVSVEAPSGLRYTFTHNQAYGVGSLMAWVGGVMTPFPPRGGGFHCGGLGCYSLCGVNGFVLGVVVTVGYCPTGSSKARNPLSEAPPRAPKP